MTLQISARWLPAFGASLLEIGCDEVFTRICALGPVVDLAPFFIETWRCDLCDDLFHRFDCINASVEARGDNVRMESLKLDHLPTVGQINCCSPRISRTGDLTFDAVRIGKIHTPVFSSGRDAGGFEPRDRIGWIVIRDTVAVVIQAGLLILEERQPAFAGGKKTFSSRRFQAKMFLIPFLRTLHIGHAQRDMVEIGGIKGGGRVRRIGCGASGFLIGERNGRAHARGKHAGQIRDQLPPAQPAVLEVVDHFDNLSLHGGSYTNLKFYLV
jgi:hypothetical protein